MRRLRQRLFRAHQQDDAGFSLLESVVALGIATIVFTALGAAMISSMKAVLVGRSSQMSADVAQKELEAVRALGFDEIAMRETDLATNDPLAMTATSLYDPATNSVSASGEELVLDPVGSVFPHVVTRTVNQTAYTIRTYVTAPADSTGAATKRVTVVVGWTQRGEARSRIVSTLVTETRRGLPLPDYKFTNNGTASLCRSPGTTAAFGFTLTNNGARDSWAITSSGGTATWSYYLDDGSTSPGAYGADDTLVANPATEAVIGSIDPTESVNFWAVADLLPTASLSTATVTFRATSVAQPTYSSELSNALQVAALCAGTPTPTPTGTATPTSTATPTPTPTSADPASTTPPAVSYASCPAASLPEYTSNGVTPSSYYFHNGSTNVGNTTAQSPMPLTTAVPISTTLWNYSTDLSANTAGRKVTSTSPAIFERTFGVSTKLKKAGRVTFHAAPLNGLATTPLQVTVTVKRLNSSGTALNTWTGSVGSTTAAWGCAGFQQFGIAFDFGNSGVTWASSDVFQVTVSSSADALIAYDTKVHESSFVLPVA